MDKITMLGTGHAMTSECFNTCFVYENEHGKMLVDTGGGQQLVTQLRKADINPQEIEYVFLTHRHTDHILGLPWLLRMRMRGLDTQPLNIITHPELCEKVKTLISTLLPEVAGYIGKTLLIISVEHGQQMTLLGRRFRFYDTRSDNVTQYGFVITLPDGGRFVFNGDVPYNEANREIMLGAKWLMHEAFCLEKDKMSKMKKHSCVADAAKYASELSVERLILVHGSDNDIHSRKVRYSDEASSHFSGTIHVPDDLDCIEL